MPKRETSSGIYGLLKRAGKRQRRNGVVVFGFMAVVAVACALRMPQSPDSVAVQQSPGPNEPVLEQAPEAPTVEPIAAPAAVADEQREERPANADIEERKKNLENQIAEIEERKRTLESQIADIDTKRLANQAELKTSREMIAALETQLANLPATPAAPQVEKAIAADDGRRQMLAALQARERELAAKLQEDHPRLAAVRQQVRELEQTLGNEPTTAIPATEEQNSARRALARSLLAEKAHAHALEARERSLAAAWQKLHGELTELAAQAVTISEQAQQAALAESSHKEDSERPEQPAVSRTPDVEPASSVSTAEPTGNVAMSKRPPRLQVLVLGLVVAGLFGVATMLIAAWLNPLITTAEQLAAVLDVPLTGTVPRRASAATA